MRGWVVLACCLVLPRVGLAAESNSTTAAPEAQERVEIANSILERSQFRSSIGAWQRMLVTQQVLLASGGGRDQRLAEAWGVAVQRGLDAGRIEAKLRDGLLATFSTAELRAMKRFHESPLGLSISAATGAALDAAHRDPGDVGRQMAEVKRMQEDIDLRPKRKAALERVSRASGGADAQVDILANIQLGLALGFSAAIPKGQPRASADEIAELVTRSRPIIQAMVAATLLAGYERLYKPLTTDEVNAYADFLESDLGRKMAQFNNDWGPRVMYDGMKEIGAEFAKAIHSIDL